MARGEALPCFAEPLGLVGSSDFSAADAVVDDACKAPLTFCEVPLTASATTSLAPLTTCSVFVSTARAVALASALTVSADGRESLTDWTAAGVDFLSADAAALFALASRFRADFDSFVVSPEAEEEMLSLRLVGRSVD